MVWEHTFAFCMPQSLLVIFFHEPSASHWQVLQYSEPAQKRLSFKVTVDPSARWQGSHVARGVGTGVG